MTSFKDNWVSGCERVKHDQMGWKNEKDDRTDIPAVTASEKVATDSVLICVQITGGTHFPTCLVS